MKIAVIIPDHGGRDELIKFAKWQIERQTSLPDKIYHIDFPGSGKTDLVARLKLGCEMAKADGMDAALIWEDDYYPADYIERMTPNLKTFDFVGQNYTYYYNLKKRGWKKLDNSDHKYRSSLFCTGFKLSALNHWDWSKIKQDTAFVDIELWKYAKRKTKAFINTGAIGIKHGLGRCGGKGHLLDYSKNPDPELKWLRHNTDEKAFEFYKELSEKLIFQTV